MTSTICPVIWGSDEGESKVLIPATQTSECLIVSCATKFLKRMLAVTQVRVWPELISGDPFGYPRYIPIHIPNGNAGITSMLILHKRTKNRDQAMSALHALQLRYAFPPRQRSGNARLTSIDLAQAGSTLTSARLWAHDTGEEYDAANDLISLTLPQPEWVLESGLHVPIMPGRVQIHLYSQAGLVRFVGMQHKDIFAQMRKEGAGYDRTHKGLKLGGGEFNSHRLKSAVSAANEAYRTLPVMDDYITFWLCEKMRAWKDLP